MKRGRRELSLKGRGEIAEVAAGVKECGGAEEAERCEGGRTSGGKRGTHDESARRMRPIGEKGTQLHSSESEHYSDEGSGRRRCRRQVMAHLSGEEARGGRSDEEERRAGQKSSRLRDFVVSYADTSRRGEGRGGMPSELGQAVGERRCSRDSEQGAAGGWVGVRKREMDEGMEVGEDDDNGEQEEDKTGEEEEFWDTGGITPDAIDPDDRWQADV